jgi:hypothetical protein
MLAKADRGRHHGHYPPRMPLATLKEPALTEIGAAPAVFVMEPA